MNGKNCYAARRVERVWAKANVKGEDMKLILYFHLLLLCCGSLASLASHTFTPKEKHKNQCRTEKCLAGKEGLVKIIIPHHDSHLPATRTIFTCQELNGIKYDYSYSFRLIDSFTLYNKQPFSTCDGSY